MAEELGRFASLAAARSRLQHSISLHLLDYYTGLYAQQGMPVRSAIDPSGMRPCLPHMAIMDCDTPAQPRYRLAGESYIQLLGTNPTGKAYLDFVPPARHATAAEAYVACMTYRCGMLTELVTTGRFGQEVICEVVNLPACDDVDPTRPRFLYVTLVPQGDNGWQSSRDTEFSKYREVRKRAFIDLGFGTPALFDGRPVEDVVT